jgi:PilZ domain
MGTRREPRVPAKLPVRIFGSDATGRPFSENVRTVDISRYGAKLEGMKALLAAGEVVGMSHGASKGRFVVQWAGQPETSQAGQLGLLNNAPDKWTWEMKLPPAYIDNYAGGARAAGDRRKHVRMKSANSVQVQPEGDSAPIWGKTIDISEGGCFVEMPIPLEVNTHIKITLWIDDRKLWSKARIVSKRPGFGNGVHFTEMSAADTQVLDSFLKSLRESRQTAAGTP